MKRTVPGRLLTHVLLPLLLLPALLLISPPGVQDEALAASYPTARSNAYTVAEDRTLLVKPPGVLGNDSDADGNVLIARFSLGVEHGTLKLNSNGSFSYVPNRNFDGTDYFKYKACERAAPSRCSRAQPVRLGVASVNDAPVARDDTYYLSEDGVKHVAAPGVLSNDSDVDGDRVYVAGGAITSGPSHGTASIDYDGSLTYRPDPNFRGTDSLTYKVSDGKATESATVYFKVAATQDKPVASNDLYVAFTGRAKQVLAPGVLADDRDPDGDRLNVVQYTQPPNAGVTVYPRGGFGFRGDAGFVGRTAFWYQVHDGHGHYDWAKVYVSVKRP